MAALPLARADFLLGFTKYGPQTPSTMAGRFGEIRSYQLLVAIKDDDGWLVRSIATKPDGSRSLATNRHLSALRQALYAQGYRPDGASTVPDFQHWSIPT